MGFFTPAFEWLSCEPAPLNVRERGWLRNYMSMAEMYFSACSCGIPSGSGPEQAAAGSEWPPSHSHIPLQTEGALPGEHTRLVCVVFYASAL